MTDAIVIGLGADGSAVAARHRGPRTIYDPGYRA